MHMHMHMLVGSPLQGATSIPPPRLCRPLCSSSSIESGGQSEEEERFTRPQDSSLQSILRSVPLARRGVEYVAPLASRGEYGRSVAHSPLLLPPPSRVLELSAGSTAAWSSRVHAADSSDGSMLVVAADLTPPADAAEGGPLPCSRQTACRSSEPSLSPQAPASLSTSIGREQRPSPAAVIRRHLPRCRQRSPRRLRTPAAPRSLRRRVRRCSSRPPPTPAREGMTSLLSSSGHMLCTCRWPSRPFAFCRAAAATTAAAASSPPPLGEEATLQPAAATLQPAAAQRAARTCGGIAVDAEGVDGFVEGLRPLLGRRGAVSLAHRFAPSHCVEWWQARRRRVRPRGRVALGAGGAAAASGEREGPSSASTRRGLARTRPEPVCRRGGEASSSTCGEALSSPTSTTSSPPARCSTT